MHAKSEALSCANVKGGMDKGGHYDMKIKGWMQKGAI